MDLHREHPYEQETWSMRCLVERTTGRWMPVQAKAVRSPRDCVFWAHGWGRVSPDVLIPTLLTDLAAVGNSQRPPSSYNIP